MFENVTMLAGIGGAAVPLVIHLLAQARYRNMDWGAMMFLDAAHPAYRDAARLRQGALLAIRMAAVALLAVALARPTLSPLVAPADAASSELRTSAAIVIDCSASMAYTDIAGTRLDAAKQDALQILSTLKRPDRACLILAPKPSQTPVFTSDLQSIAGRISELKPQRGFADLPAAINLATQALLREEQASRRLYVICDRQAASWLQSAGAATPATAGLAQFAVIPVGGTETDNIAIESITTLDPPVVAGAPALVEVRIHNYGPQPRQGVPLSLRTGGREVFVTTLNLPAAQTLTVDATVTFPASGSQILTARVHDAAPGMDDSLDHVIDVSPPLRVLLIRGPGAGDPIGAALAPWQASRRRGPDLAAVTELAFDDWDASTDLSKYQLVILDDVPSVSDQRDAANNTEVKALEQFVYAGGGLLIAPGESARTDDYNRTLYREEGGLLPALLQPKISPASACGIDIATIDATHPALHFLAGRSAPLEPIVDRYIPTTGRTASARALASFTSGDPFILDSPYGRGHVLLVTCSLRSQWSTLPLTSLYLPLVQSMARYLASSDMADSNLSLGDELVATFEPPLDEMRVNLRRPDGAAIEVIDAPKIEGHSEVRYARTDVPGIYRIWAGRGAKQRSAMFCVSAPVAESDPTPLTSAQWKNLASRYGFSRIESDGRPLAAQLSHPIIAGDEWIVLLAGVLILLVTEMGLARWWSSAQDRRGEAA